MLQPMSTELKCNVPPLPIAVTMTFSFPKPKKGFLARGGKMETQNSEEGPDNPLPALAPPINKESSMPAGQLETKTCVCLPYPPTVPSTGHTGWALLKGQPGSAGAIGSQPKLCKQASGLCSPSPCNTINFPAELWVSGEHAPDLFSCWYSPTISWHIVGAE
jgi:hypothetical protein